MAHFAHDGTLLVTAANYYEHEGPMNNMSEARALVDCTTALDKVFWGDAMRLVVTGDSCLVISFTHHTARSDKCKLITAM